TKRRSASPRPAPEQNAAQHPHGQCRNKAPLSIPTASTGTKRRSASPRPAPEQNAAQHPHGQCRNKAPLTSPAPAPEQIAAQYINMPQGINHIPETSEPPHQLVITCT
ncbi:hypothetical protein N8W30_21310, partial [Enterobacter hormaechei subsp. steigerwaltii]|nr:hypothetical protein [Enterobacter hormaechei subsp. steigerwaltii]